VLKNKNEIFYRLYIEDIYMACPDEDKTKLELVLNCNDKLRECLLKVIKETLNQYFYEIAEIAIEETLDNITVKH